jgi:hypothetical protein
MKSFYNEDYEIDLILDRWREEKIYKEEVRKANKPDPLPVVLPKLEPYEPSPDDTNDRERVNRFFPCLSNDKTKDRY